MKAHVGSIVNIIADIWLFPGQTLARADLEIDAQEQRRCSVP
jgi:hypothetical protein